MLILARGEGRKGEDEWGGADEGDGEDEKGRRKLEGEDGAGCKARSPGLIRRV